jgi:hypothetical protein
MEGGKISRNDPCPCGSGKKFKHCCISKNIDWEARRAAGMKRPMPFAAPRPKIARPPSLAALGPYRVVDARLKEIAKTIPESAACKTAIEGLSDTTPDGERMEAYKVVREARAVPDDAVFFLFGHAAQWMPSGEDDLERHTLAVLRRHGLDDMTDLYASNRLEFERRHERGRQFFYGSPDEALAKRLREKGIID